MDLAAKRRQLEEIRAAREAKQQSLQRHQSNQHKTSSSSPIACSGTTKSSVVSSVADEPSKRVGLSSSSDVQSAKDSMTASMSAVKRPPVVPSARPVLGEPRSKCSPHKSAANAETAESEGAAWRLEVGVGAFVLSPAVTEKDVDKNLHVETATAMAVKAEDGDIAERLCENEESGRIAMPTPDVPILLAHSISAETCVNCKDRCVLDMTLLEANFFGGRPSGNDDDSGFLVASALSEPCHVGEKNDGAPQMHSGRTGEGVPQSPLPTSTSAAAAASAAAANTAGEMCGLVLLWYISRDNSGGTRYTVVPLCFHSEIRVLSYSRHRPHLLFGGAANGSVVGWRIDLALQGQCGAVMTTGAERLSISPSSLRLPSLNVAAAAVAPSEQSFPSPHTHRSRVLAMAVHGDANYHHLYTISQDGRVCMWAPLQLRLPTSSRDGMVLGQSLGCIGSCAAFVDKAADAMSKVVVGCLDGRVLEGRTKTSRIVEMSPINAAMPTSTGSDVFLRRSSTPRTAVEIPAHNAAVLVVAPHPLHADPRVSDTVLTAAADGSCSLWLGARRIAIDGFSAQVNCLRWSPTNPAVFVAGESNGRVAAWDLTRNSCSPVASLYLPPAPPTARWPRRSSSSATSAVNAFAQRSAAVTALFFSDDGAWLSCGTANGGVYLLHMRSDLSMESTAAVNTINTAVKGNSPRPSGSEAAPAKCDIDGGTAAAEHHAVSSWIDARFVL